MGPVKNPGKDLVFAHFTDPEGNDRPRWSGLAVAPEERKLAGLYSNNEHLSAEWTVGPRWVARCESDNLDYYRQFGRSRSSTKENVYMGHAQGISTWRITSEAPPTTRDSPPGLCAELVLV
jgi:hypothetical protein